MEKEVALGCLGRVPADRKASANALGQEMDSGEPRGGLGGWRLEPQEKCER